MSPRFMSLFGLLTMVGLAWCLSRDRRHVPWKMIAGGIALQFAFGALILKTQPGLAVFERTGALFSGVIEHVDSGSTFMFGFNGEDLPPRLALLRTVAFGVLPTIVFFSSLMSILYYLGIMQRLVEWLAWTMQRTLGTSGAESLSAAANIFVGQTEAPLVIRPYVGKMTMSELNAVMVGGFATIAGGVMAIYVAMGVDAGHLLTASVISAPAALLIAKLMVPETEVPRTLGHVKIHEESKVVNVVEAAAVGASDGMQLAINVGAMLIAFLALLSLANGIIGWVGDGWYAFSANQWGSEPGVPWSLEGIMSYLFAPLAWIMGIPWEDCGKAGSLLGIKVAANEFIAFDGLGRWQSDESAAPNPRTVLIMTYALSGFANFGSIGIQIGGIGSIAPERRSDLAKLGFRAMIGGTLAAFMTACVAGILTSDAELANSRRTVIGGTQEAPPENDSPDSTDGAARDSTTWLVGQPIDSELTANVVQEVETSPVVATRLTPRLRRPVQLISVDNDRHLAVVNRCGSVSVVSVAAQQVISEFDVGERLSDAAQVDRNHFVVVDEGANRLRLVAIDSSLSCREQCSFAIGAGARNVVVRDNHVSVASEWARQIHLFALTRDEQGQPELTPGHTIDLGFAPRQQIVVGRDSLVVADAYGGWLAKIDLVSGSLVRSKRLYGSHNIADMTLSPDGSELYVSHQMLDANKPTTGPNVHWGDIMSNVIRRVELAWLDSDTQKPSTVAPYHYLGFPDRAAGDPGRLLITSRNQVIVAFAGVSELAVSEKGLASHYERIMVGRRPSAFWLAPDESMLYVANQFDDSISVIDCGTWESVKTVSLGPMSALTPRDKGEMLFYDARLSSDGWFSCHSCHTDGHTNGEQSDTFGDNNEGSAKQVPSLLGVADTRPWGWDGAVESLDQQIKKSIQLTMRGPELPDADVDAISVFLKSLQPPVPLNVARGVSREHQVKRGRQLFVEHNCTDCHQPGSYTTAEVYDVGLRDENDHSEFNPPSLRGVAHRPRLLHDGQAANFREALEVHPNGSPLPLSDSEWDDLAAFLRTL